MASQRLVWRIYYADGSVADNRNCRSWEDAPLDGVQAVAVFDEIWGRKVFYGTEYYLMGDKSSWTSISGVDDLNAHLRACCKHIKHGLCVGKKLSEEMFERSMHDPDFPMKSPRRRSTDR